MTETPTVTSVQAKIESATVTLNTAIESSTVTQQTAAAPQITAAQTAINAAESATVTAAAAQTTANELSSAPQNTKVYTTDGYVAPTPVDTPTVTTRVLPTMYDAATKIETPFDIKMGDVLYNGQGPNSQIYVTSKATITFGTGDFNWWDFPNTPNISVFASDYQNAGTGASTVVKTTETTLEVDWTLHKFADPNGPLTNINWKMTVNPGTGEWTGIGKISGNSTNLWNGPRTGVRETAGQPVQPMTNVSSETIAAAQATAATAIANANALADTATVKVAEAVTALQPPAPTTPSPTPQTPEPTPSQPPASQPQPQPEPQPQPQPSSPSTPSEPTVPTPQPETQPQPEKPVEPVKPEKPAEENPSDTSPKETENPEEAPEDAPEDDTPEDTPDDSENPQDTPESSDNPQTDSPEDSTNSEQEPSQPEEEPQPTTPEEDDETDEVSDEPQPEELEETETDNQEQDNQSEETQDTPIVKPSKPEPTPQTVISDALADGKLTAEEKAAVITAIVADLKPGETVSSETIKEAGLTYEDLPPETPVDVRTDENGNAVVITAEVAASLELLANPTELIGELFTDPGAALAALSNIGADMSPEEREEATKMVVATVVAAGAAMNAAAVAAASTTTGGSSRGGSSSGGGAPTGDMKAVRRRRK